MTFLATSCLLSSESPIESSSNDVNLIQSNDIIVTNSGNDSIVLLDENGNFKRALVDSPTDATLIYNALAYDSANDQILFNNDSTTASLDAIKSISLYNGTVSNVIQSSNLNGILPGLARLVDGDLISIEGTTTLEKFDSDGVRVGAPFASALIANLIDLNPLASGGYIVCSTATANTVRTYNAAGTLQATATSASPTPTLGALAASGCTEDSQGRIIVAYSGATDAVRAYTSNAMTTVDWTFQDTNYLTSPGKVAVRPNGNILVTDTVLNHIVEISPDGAFIRLIGGAVLATPLNILVVP
jgi:hypothetical protein